MNKKYNIKLEIYFKNQINSNLFKNFKDNYFSLLEQKGLNDIIFADKYTMFTQKPLNDLLNSYWKIGNHCFRTNFQNLQILKELPEFISIEEMTRVNPNIYVFNSETINSEYYKSWFNKITEKYLEDKLLYEC